MRRKIKAMSYGLAYGLSAFGLSQQLNIEAAEARGLMDAYFERFGGVRDYLRRVVDEARATGYTATLFGRRRYLPDLNSDNRQRREAAERMALNAPIQGTAADIVKIAMLNVDKALREAGLTSRMLLQVHDEIVLEIAPGERAAAEELVRREMANAVRLSVPWASRWARGRTGSRRRTSHRARGSPGVGRGRAYGRGIDDAPPGPRPRPPPAAGAVARPPARRARHSAGPRGNAPASVLREDAGMGIRMLHHRTTPARASTDGPARVPLPPVPVVAPGARYRPHPHHPRDGPAAHRGRPPPQTRPPGPDRRDPARNTRLASVGRPDRGYLALALTLLPRSRPAQTFTVFVATADTLSAGSGGSAPYRRRPNH